MTRTAIRNIVIVLGMLLLAAAIASDSKHPESAQRPDKTDSRIAAADAFTSRYAKSRLSGWNIRARASGTDCDVLFVNTAIILEDSMIEAMHYGAGAYDVDTGGVQQFYRDRTFRGVAYKDGSGRIWTYGAVSVAEAEGMRPCRKKFL